MPLDCELQKSFWEFSPQLDVTGWLEWTGVEHFSSLGQFGTDNTPGSQALVNLLPLRASHVNKNRVLWCVFKWFIFLCLCWKPVEIFACYLLWELGVDPAGKSHNVVHSYPLPHDWVSLEFSTHRLVHAECPIIHQLHFRFSYLGSGPMVVSTSEWISTLVSPDSLYSPVHFSNLESCGLPCVFYILWIQKELLIF